MANILLIHGAYQGGWIWTRVAARLRAAGHLVLAPSLDGCGERAHAIRPGITTESQAEELASLLFHEDLARYGRRRHLDRRDGDVPAGGTGPGPHRPAGLRRCAGAAGWREAARYRRPPDRGEHRADQRAEPGGCRRAALRRARPRDPRLDAGAHLPAPDPAHGGAGGAAALLVDALAGQRACGAAAARTRRSRISGGCSRRSAPPGTSSTPATTPC